MLLENAKQIILCIVSSVAILSISGFVWQVNSLTFFLSLLPWVLFVVVHFDELGFEAKTIQTCESPDGVVVAEIVRMQKKNPTRRAIYSGRVQRNYVDCVFEQTAEFLSEKEALNWLIEIFNVELANHETYLQKQEDKFSQDSTPQIASMG